MTTLPTDLDLFKVISDLLSVQRRVRRRDQRSGDRRPYPCVQLLAPYDGKRFPSQADFARVQCHDLSPRGFAFLARCPPEHRQVMVALGEVPFTFFTAEVMHVSPVDGPSQRHYVIGCRFLRRVRGESAGSSARRRSC